MISVGKLHGSGLWGVAALVFLFTWMSTGSALAADGYDDLFRSMQARQAAVERYQLGPQRCLGERLDGLLEIRSDCPPDARTLAEDENRDREALYRLMASDSNRSPEQIGRERAWRYLERYRAGVLRQVRISDTETTWWDGLLPDPRETAVSRVLALHGARIHRRPDASSPVVRDNIQQYEAFGVVDSKKGGSGESWFQVTEDYVPKVKPPGWSPAILGWIAAKDSIPWRRAVVMRFTSSYRRSPSLFFQDPDPLLELIRRDATSRKDQLDRIRSRIKRGEEATHAGVIALEPAVSPRQERFIMYPVLDFYGRERGARNDLRIDGKSALLLEVAARTRSGAGGAGSPDGVAIDILFVMDTTNSMDFYLEAVLVATEEFAAMSENDDIRFGFIGYRDENPAFGYQVKPFTRNMQPAASFVRALRGVKARPSPVKDDDIPEAVFEGIDAALETPQWRDGVVKIIFLIGDAPGRVGRLNSEILRDKAFTRKIGIFAFHIRGSAKSSAWDSQAQKQYRELSLWFEGAYGTGRKTSRLFSIDAGSSDFQRRVLDRFREAQSGFDKVRMWAEGKLDGLPEAEKGSLSEFIFQQAAVLLADKSLPENDIRGWVCDKVLTNPGKEALAPMILLSETELDELVQRVEELIEVGNMALRGQKSGTTLDFFDLVSRNTRFTMVDPTAVNFRDAFSIPLGIDRLPYDSSIMAMTRDEFRNMDRVRDFVQSMTNKLQHYEDLRRQRGNPAVWKKLSAGAREGDRVVGVELNQLP